MSKSSQTLTRFGDRVGQLYTLPAVALRVMDLTDQPDVDLRALKEAIETDPALTAKILRVVNSSIFSRVGEVADLNQALALLGIQPLKMLVLGFSLPDGLFENQDPEVLARYWRRSLTKAVAAREIGSRFWHVPSDETFIAGLLDDLGQLVLLQQLKGQYIEFVKRVESEASDLESHEKETLGFNHRQLSADLLRRWQLPETILRGIESPRDVQQLRSLSLNVARMPQVLHLAELVADSLTRRDAAHVGELAMAADVYRNVSSNDLATLIMDVETMVAQLAGALGTDIGDDVSYHEIIAAAHTRLSAVAGGALFDVVSYRRIATDRDVEEEVWDETTALSDCLTTMLKWAVPAEEPLGITKPQGVTKPQTSPEPDLRTAPAAERLGAGEVPFAAGSTLSPSAGGDAKHTLIAKSSSTRIEGSERLLCTDVGTAIALCRAKRWSLSVILFEVNDPSRHAQLQDSSGAERTTALTAAACQASQVQYSKVCPIHETRFGWILPDCDRNVAVELARDVLSARQGDALHVDAAWMIGAGVASVSVPSKNFDPQTLIQSADRCLYGVLNSGGNGVKSIAVF